VQGLRTAGGAVLPCRPSMAENPQAEKFLELFNKSKEFTEELLRENERLRARLAELQGTVQQLQQQTEDFSSRYAEVEEQNNNLANLYVATYQLHSTLDFREVVEIVKEIIINLIGAESFAILLLDENTNELCAVASEGREIVPGIETICARLGEGVLGTVAESGQSYYVIDEFDTGEVSSERPIAAVPLKIKEHVIGIIAMYKLLQQKKSFSAVDYELFSLLAAHAATAIFSSKLYSQSERKLNTIQSFLDLLTTSS
jgi:nitrate/nitrite-specific signal transduction histidine kinase